VREVHRPPSGLGTLMLLVPSGLQLLGTCACAVLAGVGGQLRPDDALTAVLGLFLLNAPGAGAACARMQRDFTPGAFSWNAVLRVAIAFPGAALAIFLAGNGINHAAGASTAAPLSVVMQLVVLWLSLLPLVALGAAAERRLGSDGGGVVHAPDALVAVVVNAGPPVAPKSTEPTAVATVATEAAEAAVATAATEPAPDVHCASAAAPAADDATHAAPAAPWYLHGAPCAVAAALLPLRVALQELRFLLAAVWQGAAYDAFGVLALTGALWLAAVALTCVLVAHHRVKAGDARWGWRAFAAPGALGGLCLLTYGAHYLRELSVASSAAVALYALYTVLLAAAYGLMAGAVGFTSVHVFLWKLYPPVELRP
jgi:hypothetical protein